MSVIKFGRFRGSAFVELPSAYLKWLVNNVNGPARQHAEDEITRRNSSTRKRLSTKTSEHRRLMNRIFRSVSGYLLSEGLSIQGRRKAVYQRFLNYVGQSRDGVSARRRVIELWNDKTFEIIGVADESFYRCPEWRELRQRALQKYGVACLNCGSTDDICVDHIKPRSKFPELELDEDNIQILCRSCNSSKGIRTIDYRGNRNARTTPQTAGRVDQAARDEAQTRTGARSTAAPASAFGTFDAS